MSNDKRICKNCGLEVVGPQTYHSCTAALREALTDLQEKYDALLPKPAKSEAGPKPAKAEAGPTHVDDWVDRFDMGKQSIGQKYARFCLFLYRLAAVFQMDWSEWIKNHKLFCTYEGKRFRMTGASRMGDVWIIKDFDRDTGYDMRVNVDDCSNWSDNPLEYIGVLSLTSETSDASLAKLQQIRGVKNMTVSVSAEELACLMHKAKDNTDVANSLCEKMEWVQELFNKGEHLTLPGFPVAEFCGQQHPDTLRQWINNLLAIVNTTSEKTK
jgi:hypothetical protein